MHNNKTTNHHTTKKSNTARTKRRKEQREVCEGSEEMKVTSWVGSHNDKTSIKQK